MKKLLLSSLLLGMLAFGQITIYPTGGGGGYATIQDEGSSLSQRVTVNFLGSGVTCVDNPGASKTDCTISGGGGGSLSVPQTSQLGASYSLVSGDCGKWLLLTNAAPTLTVPAPLSGASDGCAIFVHPTAGNATLQTGVSATVYRNQVALLQYNGSTWNLHYSQFTNDPAGSITFSRDVNGVTSASLDTTVPRDFEGTFNVTETGNLRFEGTNNGTGTVASRLAKLAAANTLTVMATSDTDEPLGVCVSGCGNSGTAVVVFRGNVACEADNTVAANDWISIGTTTAGRCKSEGGTEPTSGWILGRARTGASAGSTFTLLLQARKAGGGSGAPTDATYITQTANGTLSAEQALGALASGLMRNTTTTGVVTIAKADEVSSALYCADAGSTDAYACNLTPAITAYVTGTHYFFKANTVNTGAATINFNSLGAITIKKFTSASPGADLANNDIRASQIVEVVYDGTNMQMVSALGNAAAGGQTLSTTDQGYWITGPICCDAASSGNVTYTNLTPRFQGIANPFASVTINEAAVYVTSNEAAKNARIAFFDSACTTKLGESDNFSVATAGPVTVNFSTPVVLTGSYFYLGVLTDATSSVVALSGINTSTILAKVVNQGAATAQVFHGAAVGSLAFGATCGARTTLDGFTNYEAAVYVRP